MRVEADQICFVLLKIKVQYEALILFKLIKISDFVNQNDSGILFLYSGLITVNKLCYYTCKMFSSAYLSFLNYFYQFENTCTKIQTFKVHW